MDLCNKMSIGFIMFIRNVQETWSNMVKISYPFREQKVLTIYFFPNIFTRPSITNLKENFFTKI